MLSFGPTITRTCAAGKIDLSKKLRSAKVKRVKVKPDPKAQQGPPEGKKASSTNLTNVQEAIKSPKQTRIKDQRALRSDFPGRRTKKG